MREKLLNIGFGEKWGRQTVRKQPVVLTKKKKANGDMPNFARLIRD